MAFLYITHYEFLPLHTTFGVIRRRVINIFKKKSKPFKGFALFVVYCSNGNGWLMV